MKKLLLLFSLVLYAVTGMAQTQEEYDSWGDTQPHDAVVNDLSELSNYKVYSVIPEDWYHATNDPGNGVKPNGLFGVLCARADAAEEAATGGKADRLIAAGGWGNTIDNQDPRKDIYGGWQTEARAIQKDSYDPRQQFAIIEFEGNYYLWAVAAKKFVSVHDLSYLGTSTFYADVTNEKFSTLRLEKSEDTAFRGPYIGDADVTGPRFRFYFTNTKDNLEYRMHFSYAWHNNATYQTECLLTADGASNDGLDIFELCERGTFDPTEALTILDDYLHPKSTVVYHVTDGEGGEILTSDAYPIQTGTVVSDLPDNLKEEFYTYICDPLTIQLGENTLELVKGPRVYPVEYTEDPGTTITASDVANGKFYYLSLNNQFLYVDGSTLKYSSTLEESDAYQWTFVMADNMNETYGDGCFRIFNKTLGAAQYLYYQGANVRMRPYNASSQGLAMTPYGSPYGSGFALSKVGDRDNYAQISTEVEGAIQFTPGEGVEGGRKYPLAAHGMKVYSADESLPEVEVTMRVAIGATTYAEETYSVPIGTEISELGSAGFGDELFRDFTDYEYSDPVIALPDNVNILVATPTFNLPFKEGKTYPIVVDGMFLKADVDNRVVVADPDVDEFSIVGDNTYYWSFRGNPYGGIEITNVETGLHIGNVSDLTDNVALPLSENAEWWFIYDNGGMLLYGQSAETFVVNNGGSIELSLDESMMWDNQSAFEVLTPMPSLQSITIGGVDVPLTDGEYEYTLPFAYNPGLAVSAVPAEDFSLGVQDDSFGYEEYAYYEDGEDPIIMVSVEADNGDVADYFFHFTPVVGESSIGGDYSGALSVLLSVDGEEVQTPLANNNIGLSENSDGTLNVELKDFNFEGMLVGDIYVTSLEYDETTGKLSGTRNVRLYSENDEAIGLMLGHLPVQIDMTLDSESKTADASIEIVTTESTIEEVSMFERIHVDFVPFQIDEGAELEENGYAYLYQIVTGPVTKASTKFLQINNILVDTPMKFIDLTAATIADDVTADDLKQGAPEDNNTIYYLPEMPAGSLVRGSNIVCGDATEEFAINDKVGISVPVSFTADNVTYDRSFTAGNWSTFVLPVSVSVSDIDGSVYKLTGYNESEFEFTEVEGDTEANMPYLIKLNGANMFKTAVEGVFEECDETDILENAVGNLVHTGYYTRTEIASDDNQVWYGYSGGKFKKANTGTIKPFRTAFYMLADGGSGDAPAFGLNISGTTGIKNVEFSADNEPAYDLQGRRVNNAKKGVFIIGGKKVILK